MRPENTWFPGSAWEPTAGEALPRGSCRRYINQAREAEPRNQCVPRQSLGTRKDARQRHNEYAVFIRGIAVPSVGASVDCNRVEGRNALPCRVAVKPGKFQAGLGFRRRITYTSRTGSQTRRILWTNCLLLKCTVSHWITARVSMALKGRGTRPAHFVLGIHFRISPRGALSRSGFRA